MSELSPGSKATTNLFMVLGTIVLGALAWPVGNRNGTLPADCAERLLSAPEQPPGAADKTIAVAYTVMADGSITDIEPNSTQQALNSIRYSASPGAEPLNCRYNLVISAE